MSAREKSKLRITEDEVRAEMRAWLDAAPKIKDVAERIRDLLLERTREAYEVRDFKMLPNTTEVVRLAACGGSEARRALESVGARAVRDGHSLRWALVED